MGSRYMEGLDPPNPTRYSTATPPTPSAAIAPSPSCVISSAPASRRPRSAGLREKLDGAGFPRVRVVASSGFGPGKCRVMALADAPIDAVGTGSFLPENWMETYATADVIEYGGRRSVKVGREFLFPK